MKVPTVLATRYSFHWLCVSLRAITYIGCVFLYVLLRTLAVCVLRAIMYIYAQSICPCQFIGLFHILSIFI